MKNIVTIFDAPGDFDFPLDTQEYLTAYQDLSKLVREEGSRLYFARNVDAAHVARNFSAVSYFNENNELKRATNVDADVIYDKSNIIRTFDVASVINNQELKRICNDKLETYNLFSDITPMTVTAANESEYRDKIKLFNGMTVVKPQFGAKGEGVIIDERDNITISDIIFPCIIQEFVDGFIGIEGIIDGLHDLRIVIINGEIIMAYLRIPQSGSLLSNLHQGGSIKMIKDTELPTEARKMTQYIDSHLEKFGHRFYTIDSMNSPTGLKLIELNAQPGLLSRTRSEESHKFLSHVAHLLCS